MKHHLQPLPLTLFVGLALLPFVFWPGAPVPFEIPRVWLFQRWVEVMIIIAFLSPTRLNKPNPKFVFVVIAFLAAAFLASSLGPNFGKSFWGNYYRADGLITLLHLFGLFSLLALFWNKSWQKPLSAAISAGSVGISIFAILVFYKLHVLNIGPNPWNGAIGTTFGNPKFLAGFLVATLPFLAYLIKTTENLRLKILLVVGMLIQVAAIGTTLSKGGLLGIMVVFIGLILIKISRLKLLLLFVPFFFLLTTIYILHSFQTPQVTGTGANGSSYAADSRTRILTKGIIGFLKQPLTGWGWGNFDYAFSSSDWPIKFSKDVYVDKAHSTLLEILTTTGLFGFIFYSAMIFLLLVHLYKKNDSWNSTLFLAALTYLIHSQTNIISINEELVFWAILGITASGVEEGTQSEVEFLNTRMRLAWLAPILILTAAFSGFLGWWITVNRDLFKNTGLISPLSSQPKVKPLDKYAFENLSSRPDTNPTVTVEKTLKEDKQYTSYLVSYPTDGKKVSGQMNVPSGAGPFPVIVMYRGYIDPHDYQTGGGTKNSAAFFAKNGFLTFAPDFLGYGESAPNSGDILESRFQTYTTALDALSAVKSVKEADPDKVFIWGHSNGGHIALAMLEITSHKIPTVLWAPVSKPFPYSVLVYTDDSEDKGQLLRRTLAEFESQYDPNHYSLDTYLDRIQAPIQLHQGMLDTLVPFWWSDRLAKTLKSNGRQVSYFTYPKADHNLVPNWNLVVQRSLEFYKKHSGQ